MNIFLTCLTIYLSILFGAGSLLYILTDFWAWWHEKCDYDKAITTIATILYPVVIVLVLLLSIVEGYMSLLKALKKKDLGSRIAVVYAKGRAFAITQHALFQVRRRRAKGDKCMNGVKPEWF